MSDHDSDTVETRLADLAHQPVSPAVRAAHLRRAGEVGEVPTRRRFGMLAVAAAAAVGFLAGSTGLAAAGALPDSAQDVAHDVLGAVQVDVPRGNERGACVSEAAKLKDKEEKRAAKDACPLGGRDSESPDDPDAPADGDAPGKSGDAPGKSGDAPGRQRHVDDPCRGRPPWAGPMSKEERETAKSEFSRESCIEVDDDENAAVSPVDE